jgi:hypothetical protein
MPIMLLLFAVMLEGKIYILVSVCIIILIFELFYIRICKLNYFFCLWNYSDNKK